MGKRKEFIGTVTSDKMAKTVIVRVTFLTKHRKYGQIIKKYNKFKVHDEKKTAKVGDLVRIEETRPLSKDKRFRLIEVVKKTRLPQVQLKEETV
jgi:small subunit ribosomal protein S17